jgi:hypothetical protein
MLIISLISAGLAAAGVGIGITLAHHRLIKTIENDMIVSEPGTAFDHGGGVITDINPRIILERHVVWAVLISGTVFLILGICTAFIATGLIAGPFEKIEKLRRVVKSAAETKRYFLLLCILEEELQRSRETVPGPGMLTKIQNAAENYNMYEVTRAMEELKQYYQSDGELIPWLQERINRSEFEELKELLIPQEQELILFIEA